MALTRTSAYGGIGRGSSGNKYTIDASVGAFAYTGYPSAFFVSKILQAGVGTFVVYGQQAYFRYTPVRIPLHSNIPRTNTVPLPINVLPPGHFKVRTNPYILPINTADDEPDIDSD